MLDNYREPEELLSDESFLAWYFKTGEGKDIIWEQWMAANPDGRELVQQAVELLNMTRLPEKEIPAKGGHLKINCRSARKRTSHFLSR